MITYYYYVPTIMVRIQGWIQWAMAAKAIPYP